VLGSIGLNVGALVAAVGLSSAMHAVAVANSSTSLSLAFDLCILAAPIALLVLRRTPVRHTVVGVAVLRFLGFVIPVIFLSVLVSKVEGIKDKGFVATMESDLRNLAHLEERVRADSGHYTANVGDAVHPGFVVTISPVRVSASGWSATASTRSTATRCAIFVGMTPEPPAQRPGVPACTAVPLGHTMRAAALGMATLVLGLALAIAGASWRR
jgi:hypothetical protein